MKTGNSNHDLRAPNFIHEQARKRINEAVPAAQEKLANALLVDPYPALLYLKAASSTLCTCQHTPVTQDELIYERGNVNRDRIMHVDPKSTMEQEAHNVIIDLGRSSFGSFADHTEEEEPTSEDYDLDDEDDPTVASSEDSPACGICYRTGFVPGFQLYGFERMVFTTYDIKEHNGITIDQISKPNVMNILTQTGWIEFEMHVPKYFKGVRYSVRNQFDILEDKLFLADGSYLSLGYLNSKRGKKIAFRCKANQFTHIDVTFDLGSEVINTNIAQFSKIVDWEQFDAMSNISVVLPTSIPDLRPGSYIVLPTRNVTVKVADVQYLRETNNNNINWEVQTRYVQPQEPVRNIHKGFKLL